MTVEPRTRWGTRAAELYTDAYADRYRAQDEAVGPRQAAARLAEWLRASGELVKQNAERKEIAARVTAVVLQLFRGHIRR